MQVWRRALQKHTVTNTVVAVSNDQEVCGSVHLDNNLRPSDVLLCTDRVWHCHLRWTNPHICCSLQLSRDMCVATCFVEVLTPFRSILRKSVTVQIEWMYLF
ncbi:hypothetical protein SCLCIDRAFT_1105128 [Scleroderma citrinum Foug A]|uniref:Uncharacterized protein n=1 Tax=Scleroderma citrinum Foug A TaxID=1036808 RepID=A0A0C3ARB4_9AGAM|nr:hypothetical protein SCLCIDRAFT_1105128 [Scleroderma citrinum Foug A]